MTRPATDAMAAATADPYRPASTTLERNSGALAPPAGPASFRSDSASVVTVRSATKTALAEFAKPIAEPLARVEQRLAGELQSRFECVAEVLRHGTQLGGKRLRPALTLLAGQVVGGLNPHHETIATVLEMVHTATLVHDDVLDGADRRRHVPTVNARWNTDVSILLGDYLFASAYRLAATLPTPSAAYQIGMAATRVCEGEMRQVLARDDHELDEATYIELIRGKTAELCRVACALGAEYGDASDDQIDSLGRYGDCLGIAFQIADDYLDLWGDHDVVGKTLGTDLLQGKITLPILRLLQTSSAAVRRDVLQVLAGPPTSRLGGIWRHLVASDAESFTAATARRYRDEAIDALRILPDGPAKQSLTDLADFSVARTF